MLRVRKGINNYSKSIGNAIYSGLGDLLTIDVDKKGLASVVLASTLATGFGTSLVSCGGSGGSGGGETGGYSETTGHIETELKGFKLQNISQKRLWKGYERPQGLSNLGISLQYDRGDLSFMSNNVFCSGNTIKSFSDSPDEFYETPKIFVFSGNLEELLGGGISPEILYEFNQQSDIGYFESGSNIVINEEELISRPSGLILNTCLLENNSILFLSNISQDMLKFSSDGIREMYIRDSDLIGTTDIILGSDGNLYLAQTQILGSGGGVNRPKRVICINPSGDISPAFRPPELSGDSDATNCLRLEDGRYLPKSPLLKIVENTLAGMERTGDKFYFTDRMSEKIYRVKENGNVENLALDEIRFPSSINVDSSGYLYVITGPTFNNDDSFKHRPEILRIDPLTKEVSYLCALNDSVSSLLSGGCQNTPKGLFPTGLIFCSNLVEDESTINVFYTNSNTGEINVIRAEKVPAE